MAYLISTFWLWLLVALLLGGAIGWISWGKPGRGWRALLPWLGVLLLGALVAWLRLLPERLGFWFDLAMLFLWVYVIGCFLGAILRGQRQQSVPRPAPATTESTLARADALLATAPVAPAGPKEVPVEPAEATPAAAASEPVEQAITGLSAPRGGKADDLTRIYAVDRETAGTLNALGLYHYDQIAALTPEQRRWLFRQLGHEGRFPGWWWRWRYDAARLAKGEAPVTADGKAETAPVSLLAAEPTPTEKPLAASAPVQDTAPAVASAPAEPVALVSPAVQAMREGTKPEGLAAPRAGKADDLKRIRGIGKQNEGRLHGLGIWHFDQIAAWKPEEAKWVGGYLAFPGRIEREDWIAQAKLLASGAETDFSRRVDAGEVATSRDDTGDDGQANVIAPAEKPAPRGRKPRA